jgi:hypothetical protein
MDEQKQTKPRKIRLMGDETPIFTGSGCETQTFEDFTGSSSKYRLYNVNLINPEDVNKHWPQTAR